MEGKRHWMFPLKLLSWFCPDHLCEEIAGDLIQKFERESIDEGVLQARYKLFWRVITFFRPGIIMRNKFLRSKRPVMLGNYVTVMRRNFIRNKFYSIINIVGLTVGITFALLIGTFIHGELQVNKSLADVDQLYLLENKWTGADDNFAYFSPAGLSKQAVQEYPRLFENYYRFWDRNVTVSRDDKHFRVQTMIGDSTLLSMFGFKVLFGDPHTALANLYSVVISEKIAHQYFNRSDVVGESLMLKTELGGTKEFIIKAVVADLEDKNSVSDFMNSDAQMFLPLKNSDLFIGDDSDQWATDIITYMKLRPGASRDEATAVLNALLKNNLPKEVTSRRTIQLDPLSDYYLMTNNGSVRKLIVSLAAIVVFVLLLAITNFINISVAGSFSRLKEIGVRKVIGGFRRQVIIQFLSESIFLAVAAGLVSLLGYELLRGYFADALNSPLPSVLEFNVGFWIYIISGVVTTGLLAGVYPAAYLSATGTIESLKGKFNSVKSTLQFSRTLIGSQFLIAIFIFVTTLIISDQINFVLNKDLGYDQSFVLDVSSAPRLWTPEGFDKIESSKKEFLSIPQVKSISISWGAPSGSLSPRDFRLYRPGQSPEDGIQTTIGAADEDYARVYGMTMAEGKFLFDEGSTPVQGALVINEAAAKTLNAVVGDKFRIQFFGDRDFTIAGIIKDFNYETLHEVIRPVAFLHNRDFGAYRHFSFKLTSENLASSVEAVETRWKQIFPDDPFVYEFQDVLLQKRYKAEMQLKKAASIASVLIMVIVLIGVVGIVSLSVRKRNKEIGIRKVLGASIYDILFLISREYAVLMVISFVVGMPFAFLFVSDWLSGFAYRIELRWWMFLVPVIILFGITVLTVMMQSLRTALSNPITAIKYE